MIITSERREFHTLRKVYFKGKEGEEGGGAVTLIVEAEGITTENMTAELEKLATEMMEKSKKIVAAQEAPQQIFY